MRHAWLPDGPLIATVPRWMLGWRSPTRAVTFEMGADAVGGSLVEVALDTARHRQR